MSLQQIHDYFDSKIYKPCTLRTYYFNMHRLDNRGAHLKIGYLRVRRKIYISAYYDKNDDHRLDKFYQDVCNTLDTRMQRCRIDSNWAGVCNILGQQSEQWQPQPNRVAGHGDFQFRFANPYADDHLSPEFLEAIRQLADIIIANFP